MANPEILKTEILKQFKSVRQFCMQMDIPYSTLVTGLERGVDGMAYGTVIRICEKLHLNPVDFTPLDQETELGVTLLQNEVMHYYLKLNQEGRNRILDMMEDYSQLDKYTAGDCY